MAVKMDNVVTDCLEEVATMVNVIDLSDIGAAREDEKPKSKGIHIAVIEPGKDPYLKKIAPDADGNYLGAFQDEVGGLVEAYEPPFGETPLLWVNEEFLFNGSTPNRAIYANKRMEGIGYLSQFGDHSKAVKAGELYGILCGTFIAVGYDRDEEGNDKPRDITVEEWLDVCAAFAGIRSVLSGALEVTGLQREHCTEHIKVNLPGSKADESTGNGEGVWVLVNKPVKEDYDADARGGFYFGILDNDSCYWPGLNHGAVIPFEMRGDKRPWCLTNGFTTVRSVKRSSGSWTRGDHAKRKASKLDKGVFARAHRNGRDRRKPNRQANGFGSKRNHFPEHSATKAVFSSLRGNA